MDSAAIQTAVEAVLASGVSPVTETDLPDYRGEFGPAYRSLCTVTPNSVSAVYSLAKLLEQQSGLKQLFASQYKPGPDDGGLVILPLKVANWLLARCVYQGESPGAAVNALSSFVANPTCLGMRVVAICGVAIPSSTQISDSISLAPLHLLQPSIPRDHLYEALGTTVMHLPSVRDEYGIPYAPLAALVQHFEMTQPVREAGTADPDWFKQHEQNFVFLRTLAISMTLDAGTIPQILSQWVDAIGLDSIPGRSGSSTGEFELMEVIPGWRQEIRPLSTETIDLLGRFSKLSADLQKQLEVPLTRMALSKSRRKVGDKAIELCIALEGLLSTKEEKSEISHRIAARGSILSTEPGPNRIHNYRLLKKVYNLRSSVVHGDQPKSNVITVDQKNYSLEDAVRASQDLLGSCIKRVMAIGRLPNWEEVDVGHF